MDDEAQSELKWIVMGISPESRLAVRKLPEGGAALLHHGLGTLIRNRIRSGDLKALSRWSAQQVPGARNLDDRA